MAFLVTISPPYLVADEVLVKTIVEVSEDKTFTTGVIHYEEEETPLSITIPDELRAGVTHYMRTRFVLEPGGLQGWSDVRAFIPSDTNEGMNLHYVPRRIGTPEITVAPTDEGAPYTMLLFRLAIPDLPLSDHKCTVWTISDIYGNVVYSTGEDSDNLTTFYFQELLQPGKIYRISAYVKSHANVVSPTGSVIFTTATESREFRILRDTIQYDAGDVIRFETTIPLGYDYTVINIYQRSVKVNSFVEYGGVIDMSQYPQTGPYLIQVICIYQDGDKSEPCYIYVPKNEEDMLPAPIPYTLRKET